MGGGCFTGGVTVMFRLEFHDASEKLNIRIEGRIAGEFADEIRTLVARRKLPAVVVVDISEVTFLDEVGEEVLCWLARIGGRFVAEKFYSRRVSEALRLPLARKSVTSAPPTRLGKTIASTDDGGANKVLDSQCKLPIARHARLGNGRPLP
jgi:hypothetical protein